VRFINIHAAGGPIIILNTVSTEESFDSKYSINGKLRVWLFFSIISRKKMRWPKKYSKQSSKDKGPIRLSCKGSKTKLKYGIECPSFLSLSRRNSIDEWSVPEPKALFAINFLEWGKFSYSTIPGQPSGSRSGRFSGTIVFFIKSFASSCSKSQQRPYNLMIILLWIVIDEDEG